MEKKYAIILFKGKEYLCGHEDGCHYDVSCPVRTFTEGEDDFKFRNPGKTGLKGHSGIMERNSGLSPASTRTDGRF